MEEVAGFKERQVKNDIASKTNGDQASCKNFRSERGTVAAGVTVAAKHKRITDAIVAIVSLVSNYHYDGHFPSDVCQRRPVDL